MFLRLLDSLHWVCFFNFAMIAGTWKFLESTNSSSKFPDFRKSSGNSIIELVSTPTKINGVHYVQVSALELCLVTIMSDGF